MDAPSLRRELDVSLDQLNAEQLQAILQLVRLLPTSTNGEKPEYDPAKDPFINNGEPSPAYNPAKDRTIGLISGPTDLSTRTRELLAEGFDPLSGWTQKKDEV